MKNKKDDEWGCIHIAIPIYALPFVMNRCWKFVRPSIPALYED